MCVSLSVCVCECGSVRRHVVMSGLLSCWERVVTVAYFSGQMWKKLKTPNKSYPRAVILQALHSVHECYCLSLVLISATGKMGAREC